MAAATMKTSCFKIAAILFTLACSPCMAGPTAVVSPSKLLGGPQTLFGVPRLAALFVRGGEIQEVVTLEEVEDIIRQAKEEGTLVVIDFYSQNCPPCKMIAPLYEELSDEFEGVVRFLKVDVDQNPDATANFQVDGWPTFLLVKNGEVQEEIVGGNAAKLGLYDMVVKYA